jgi:ComF family protein
VWESLVELVYPPACIACDALVEPNQRVCAACEVFVLDTPEVRCRHCSEPGFFESGRCPRCTRSPPPFELAYAPFEHAGAIARAIHRYKYEDRSDLSRPIGAWLADVAAPRVQPRSEVIVPIPLHAARFRERGYDQTVLLAVELGERWRLPVRDDWLKRERATQRQVRLDESAREQNVSGAFRVERDLTGCDVMLIDDVYTTGATAAEAARTLRSAGAQQVRVLTVARAKRAFTDAHT